MTPNNNSIDVQSSPDTSASEEIVRLKSLEDEDEEEQDMMVHPGHSVRGILFMLMGMSTSGYITELV
jgi:hypothetical protein